VRTARSLTRLRSAACAAAALTALGLVAPTSALASGTHHLPVRVVAIGKDHRAERIIAVTGNPKQVDECTGNQQLKFAGSIMTAGVWTNDCNAPAECSNVAQLQEQSPTDGVWFTLDTGSTVWSCDGAKSVASASCSKTSFNINYRTRAIFTILWDDGGQTGPTAIEGAAKGYKYGCEG